MIGGNGMADLSKATLVNLRADMRDYDSLPAAVRRRIAESALPYAACDARDLLAKTPESIVSRVIVRRDERVYAEHRRRVGAGLPLCTQKQ